MKKTLLLAAMTVLGFGLAHADFSQGAGHFYMVQNKATKRYINLIHDQGNALSQDFHAIRLENDGEQHTEPGTLIYISSGYNLSAQGTSVKDITGYSVNIKQNGTGDKNEAVYNAWVTAGFLFFKQDVYFQDEAGKGFDKAGTGDADDCRWYIKPVDTGNGGDCYFGVSPKQSDYLDGYYYTTLRASFAYKLSQGVDAFTVVGGKLNELPHDNVVPANTPVILRCKSAHASDNRLYPQAIGGKYTAESTVTSSLVSGTKYSYFKTSVVNAKVGETGSYTNGKPYGLGTAKSDANANYRVLSVKDGQLGFFDTFASAYPNDLCINGELAYMDTKSDVVLIAKQEAVTTSLAGLVTKEADSKTLYHINDGELTAVAFGDDNVLYCKDNNAYASKDASQQGQVDYMKDRAKLQTGAYDQSNWVALSLDEATATKLMNSNVINHVISGVEGVLTDKVNPTVKLTVAPTVGQESTYTPNTYIAASFGGTQTGTQGKHEQFFFVTPKPCEVASITWAMWDGSKMVAPTHVDGKVNQAGLSGEFAYGGDQSKLKENSIYSFEGIVKVNTASSKAGKLSAPAASGYTVYPLTQPVEIGSIDGNVVTAVGSLNEAAAVARVLYYNLQGQSSAEPYEGINIVKTVYTDGSTRVDKVVK